MNILFLYTQIIIPERGGVERVTSTLSDYFASRGHNVYFIAKSEERSVDVRQFYLPNSEVYESLENKMFFLSFLKEKEIDVVINQGALLSDISRFAAYAKLENIKVVSVIHNSLLSVIDNIFEIYALKFQRWYFAWIKVLMITKPAKYILKKLYILKKRKHYIELLNNSEAVLVLSRSFKDELIQIVGKNVTNVLSIPNPIVLPDSMNTIKENLILYVGRINIFQKKVDTLIKIWSHVSKKSEGWKFVVLGDGPDIKYVKKLAKFYNVKNIYFEGVQSPIEYYKKAKIFCMTSSFEGLPMTVLESLSYGVVPILFNSFSSASTLIRSNNGILVKAFDVDEYCNKLLEIMNNETLLDAMSDKAVETSKEYSIEVIGQQWIELLNNI